MTPKISVIMRTIGRASLRRAIESVEQQNRADVEIVVVAARPDITPPDSAVCAINWLPTEVPLHRCVAANTGLAAARGQYLIFLDDDDWFESGHLEKLVVALENFPDAVLAYTGVRMESENGETLVQFNSPCEPWQLLPMPRFPIHAALFRRWAVKAGECQFDVRFDIFEDWDFWLQLQKIGPFIHVPGTSAVYVQAPIGSGTHSSSYGDESYRKLWRKWGGLYETSWLASLFEHVNQLPEVKFQLDATRAEVKHLTSELHARTSELYAGTSELHAKKLEVQAITSELQARTSELHATKLEVRARTSELAAERAEAAKLRSELAASRQREQSLETHVEKVAGDLHAVLTSRTWRFTAGPRRVVQTLRQFKRRLLQRNAPQGRFEAVLSDPYLQWIERHDTVTADRRLAMTNEIAGWSTCPVISVVMPVFNPPVHFLRDALDSVLAQIYTHWELCIADDASTDPKVREVLGEYSQRDPRVHVFYRPENGHISEASNSALAIATGEFVALLDQDDQLSARALFEVAKAIRNHPDAGVIYSDEDKISEDGIRFDPYFKPDYNYELLLGQNLVSHLGVYRRSLLQEIGGFKKGMEGSQDHDLVLRCIERLEPAQVIHIPKVLYHWLAHGGSTSITTDNKPYAISAGIRAVNEHLARTCKGATAENHPEVGFYRVRFSLPTPVPKVSIIVPTRNAHASVGPCLNSLFERTRYPDFEVIVIDNGSDEPALLDYLDGLVRTGKIALLRADGRLNSAELCNRAAARSTGQYVLLLHSDTEIIDPDWLVEMVSAAARPGVGAVGARLWYPDRTLQHGGMILGVGGVAGCSHRGIAAGDPGYVGRAVLLQSFSAVSAACLLVKRSVFDEVGGFDQTNLAAWFSDVDLCLRISQAGYRNVWTPHAQLIHHESAPGEDDPATGNADQFLADVRFMEQKWGDLLSHDPAFNVNLALDDPHYALGDTPRDPG